MLTGKQKRYLRSLAQTIKPVLQVGKHGITENYIDSVNTQLDAHELIKVSVLQNVVEDKKQIAQQIAEATNSELVQIIGNQLIFYRDSKANDKQDKIILPE